MCIDYIIVILPGITTHRHSLIRKHSTNVGLQDLLCNAHTMWVLACLVDCPATGLQCSRILSFPLAVVLLLCELEVHSSYHV